MRYAKDSEEETARLLEDAASSRMKEREDSPRTIVHEIFDSNLSDKDDTVERVFSDVATVTGAGFETTASVLRLIVYHVFSNPDILSRLRDELVHAAKETYSDAGGGVIPLQTLEQLPYLTAVLMEGMRLSPAIGTRSQRIAPDRDLFYDTYRIPAGTPVGMTVLLMHTNERVYPDPHRSDPERWVLPEARKRYEKVYAPFSRGTRISLGMHLAWAEIYLVMAALLLKFDFDFEDLTPPDHSKVMRDQFIISTKAWEGIQASRI